MDDNTVLPDFLDPPLDEVVIGVQFTTPPNYNSILAGQVWEIYREEFPTVVEQPRLQPQFEMFGGNPQQGFQFEIGGPPLRIRYWFVSKDDSHLIQFQDDRLLLNWRRRGSAPYPRFESIFESFKGYLGRLKQFYASSFGHKLTINQAEITYINMIPVSDYSQASYWLRIWNAKNLPIEGLNALFGEVIYDEQKKPIARLAYELNSVVTPDGRQKAIRLGLSVRGTPAGDDVASALRLIERGRENIVKRFCDITSEEAHEVWRRQN